MPVIQVQLFFSFLIFLLIPLAFSLSFNLSQIGTQHAASINLSGDAYISNQGLQLTPDERKVVLSDKVGRATYVEQLHLWDASSGNLTDFSTHFSFVIDSTGNAKYADGLAFFLAPVGSSLPPNSGGGGLGLHNLNSSLNSSLESYVAVEFDTFSNEWDPNYGSYGINGSHVGININSLKSVVTADWPTNIPMGVQNDAWIMYSANSKTLRLNFTTSSNYGTQMNTLSQMMDLRDHLPEHVIIGFTGSTGSWFETNNINSWEFSSTLPIEAVSSDSEVPALSPLPAHPIAITVRKKNRYGLVVGLSVGLPVLASVLAFATYCLWTKYKKESGNEDFLDSSLDREFEMGRGPKEFPYSKLFHATKKFAQSEKLGEGGFGGVYRGWLEETNSYIAVKRVSRGSKQGLKEYQAEVKIISQLKHKNLVQLIGWCHKKSGELLLVYEFMPNGSLDSHLFKEKSRLTWELRYKIAKGLASALMYLQEEGIRCVLHRDIKSSNILLDSNFEAKLGDFGLARLVDHENGSQTTVLAGTMGYLAPECAITGKSSKESDVYSFGIVLLEIACGRKPRRYISTEEVSTLVECVWSLYGQGRLYDAADPKLDGEFVDQEMENMLVVGLWCSHPDSRHRPSIRNVIQVLNCDTELPILPPEMPVATYNAPVRSSSGSTAAYPAGGVSDPVSTSSYGNSSNETASSSAGSSTALLGWIG